ncbi:Non-specific serine/threonine protein kinase protein [Dioscorea alata]|uniref:Non-specific serine/threonine protein kinase protein n=1 Tax=Dioscorea alata TaxID=55571 RepID=A0ACB7W1H8_DIOAL|nr:Non-specific serine/threonine protein kinase protein [Dioscorea alata]
MSPPSFLFLFFFFLFLFSSTTFSSPLSTIAISHVSNTTIVCALLPSTSSYDLNCTAFPYGNIHSYPSSKGAYYSAIAAGDGFLCALSSLSSSSSSSPNTSVMRWWDFTHQTSLEFESKRVYIGPVLGKLASGNSHVCGLRDDTGKIGCWRWNNISIPSDMKFKDIAVGGDFLCGLLDCGDVQCFGGEENRVVLGNFTQVAAGTRHACAISVSKELHCWTEGDPSNEQETKVLAENVQAVALGDNRTCVLITNGTVSCWGGGIELPGDLVNQQFMSIEAKGNAFCGVLRSNFSLMCWGSPLFLTKHFVYPRALPAACQPISVSNCSCGYLPDYQTVCLDGTTICAQCIQSSFALPVQPSSPPPLSPPAPPSSPAPPSNNNTTDPDHKVSGTKRTTIVLIIAGSVATAISIAVIACYTLYRLSNKSGRIHNSDVRPRPGNQPRPELPTNQRLTELLSKSHGSYIEEFPLQALLAATNGFSRENKLGSGGYGTVYRATLSDGRTVAIKRAEARASTSTSLPPRRTKDKEYAFLSELALLSRVNHKNLVRLLGYCVEHHERVLVYEFMPNGSLHDHLHKLAGSELSSWSTRLRVALDAARGIEYLHSYAVPPIIHRDIKSSNILLDDSWTAKVSDFGLSLMNLNDESSPEESFHTAGTVGYMDPEYYRLQNLTAKSDVYSFGVVLLELLSGCKVIHRYEESSTPRNVVEFAVPHIVADHVHKVLDQKLPPPSPTEIEAVTYVGYLAADCVSLEGRYRPTMTEVVAALERAVTAAVPPEPTLSRSSTTRSV